MNYIKKIDGYLEVDKKIIYTTPKAYLNSILNKYLKDYDSLVKNTKRVTDIKANIPLYVSSEILLFTINGIRSYDFIAFNYYNIKEIKAKKDKTTILFIDNSEYILKISYPRIHNILKKVKKVDEYIKAIEYFVV